MNNAVAALDRALPRAAAALRTGSCSRSRMNFWVARTRAAAARARRVSPRPKNDGATAGVASVTPPPMAVPTLSAESRGLLARADSARQNKQMKEAAAI